MFDYFEFEKNVLCNTTPEKVEIEQTVGNFDDIFYEIFKYNFDCGCQLSEIRAFGGLKKERERAWEPATKNICF
jgi:hypothetical protein